MKLTGIKKIIKKINKINKDIDILLDIPGIKPRTDNKKNNTSKKKSNSKIYVWT